MVVATTLVLWGIGMKDAIPLGIASGLLNLLPFLGLIASLALPLGAAMLQFKHRDDIEAAISNRVAFEEANASSGSEQFCAAMQKHLSECS